MAQSKREVCVPLTLWFEIKGVLDNTTSGPQFAMHNRMTNLFLDLEESKEARERSLREISDHARNLADWVKEGQVGLDDERWDEVVKHAQKALFELEQMLVEEE